MAERTTTLNAILKDSVSGPARHIRSEMDGLTKSTSGLGNVLQGIGVGLGVGIFNSITGAIGSLTGAVEGFFAGALGKAGEMERFTAQLEVLLGSTEAAQNRLAELVDFAKRTPFELPGVIEASRTLQVFTGGALATGAGLQMVGDIAAGTGRPFQEVAMWVGRLYDAMQSGRPFGEAAMRLQEMGALSGTSRARIEELATAVKSGAITMQDAWAEAGGEFSRFTGLMDRQAGTLEGMMSNLADQVGQSLAGVGESLLPIAKEVIPQIIQFVQTAGNAIAGFIRDNAVAIRNWVMQIMSFVGGLVSAFFGEAKAVDAVTSSFEAATPVIGDYTGSVGKATGGAKAATDAFKDQITHLDRMTESVKRLDAAQGARYEKEIARLTEAVDAQTSAIDVADRQRSVDEQRASSLRDIADAEAAVAKAQGEGADPTDALRRVADVRARAAEFELDQADDTRKAQLEGVKSYIESIAKAEEEWASKKGLLGQLAKNEAILNSQIAAAQEAGDVQKVADLTLRLEAVKATERRAQMAKANDERIKEFDTQKTRLEELVKAASAAGAGMGAGISAGAATAGTAIKEMTFLGEADMRRLGASVTGKGGLVGQFDEARLAGEKFGRDIKVAIDTLVGAIKGLLGFIGDVKQALDEIARSDIWKALTEPIKLPKEITGRLAPGTVGEAVANDPFANWVRDNITGKALGGPVQSGRTYLVGEQGPELLHMGGNSGAITPNSALGGTTIQPGAIVISGVTDPEAVARAVMQAFQRERQRQGMSFG